MDELPAEELGAVGVEQDDSPSSSIVRRSASSVTRCARRRPGPRLDRALFLPGPVGGLVRDSPARGSSDLLQRASSIE